MKTLRLFTCLAVLGFLADSVAACAVCYGDPDSEMVRGAFMGVVVMIGVVSAMLACIAGTGLFWMHRSRKLNADWRIQDEQ